VLLAVLVAGGSSRAMLASARLSCLPIDLVIISCALRRTSDIKPFLRFYVCYGFYAFGVFFNFPVLLFSKYLQNSVQTEHTSSSKEDLRKNSNKILLGKFLCFPCVIASRLT